MPVDLKIGVQGDISYGNKKSILFPIFQWFDNHTWVQKEAYHMFYVSFQVIKTALCKGKIISLYRHCVSLWGLLSVLRSLAFIFGYILSSNSCFINQICNQPWAVLWMPIAIPHCLRLHCRTFIKVLSMLPLGGPFSVKIHGNFFFSFWTLLVLPAVWTYGYSTEAVFYIKFRICNQGKIFLVNVCIVF